MASRGMMRTGTAWRGSPGAAVRGVVAQGTLRYGAALLPMNKIERIDMMEFSWKVASLMPVDAQTAGDELSRIYAETGALEPAEIVKQSKPTDAPLHPCFEWDDTKAAEKYRCTQAANIIRCLTVTAETETQDAREVRAFVHAERTYRPIELVVNRPEWREEMLRNALSELASFQAKYQALSQLSPVFEAYQALKQGLSA